MNADVRPQEIMLRRSMLAIIVSTAAGCGKPKEELDQGASLKPVIPQFINIDERSTIDEKVLWVVIDDLLTYRGEDAIAESPMNHPELIFLDTAFLDISPTDEDVLRQDDPEKWNAIRDIQSSDLSESTENLRYRAKVAKRYAIKTDDKRILTDRGKVMSRYTRPISICLPGYNNNRDVCVIFMNIPWSIHGAVETYILQVVEGSWTVRLRQYVVLY